MAARRRKTSTKKSRKGRDAKGRFLKGFYQPCGKGARIRKAKKKRRS